MAGFKTSLQGDAAPVVAVVRPLCGFLATDR